MTASTARCHPDQEVAMKNFVPHLIVVAAVLGSGCGHGKRALACTPAPAAAPVPTTRGAVDQDTARGMVDTEETLEPDPLIRSWDRLYVVRRRLLEFIARGENLPEGLSQVLFSDDFIQYDQDAWGRMFRYRRGSSTFEVRSAGPDGCYDSADDLIATEATISRRP